MRAFDEVVNEIVKDGYGYKISSKELRQVFDSLSPDVIWNGTLWGWQENSVWEEVCEAVHQYMKDEEW